MEQDSMQEQEQLIDRFSSPAALAGTTQTPYLKGVRRVYTSSVTPDSSTANGHRGSNSSNSTATDPVPRCSTVAEGHFSHASPGMGVSTSEGGATCAVASGEPVLGPEASGASDEHEQTMLYSSCPPGFRPSTLWRSSASSSAIQMLSNKSLLNVNVPEEEPVSPRQMQPAVPEVPEALNEDASQPLLQTGVLTETLPSVKARFGSSGAGGVSSAANMRSVTPHASLVSPRTTTAVLPEPIQPFHAYLAAEFRALDLVPVGDSLWGQTERDRVYNFLLYVPYQLERLIQYSLLLCIDSFLGVLTLLPIRCMIALRQSLLALSGRTPQQPGRVLGLGGGQVFDLLCLLILLGVSVCLRTVRPGWLYYWLKDITNEFLKMSVLSTAFEIADKILGNFGIKVMEALSGTCTLWVLGRLGLRHLLCDAFVAFIIVLLHAMTLMCQGLVLAVALNSNRNGLLALLIASYFAEIKSVVFKRWDVERIRSLAWQDVVERFHLVCILVFVVVEDMASSGTWAPSSVILKESIGILGAEVVIDIVKHAVLGKFNNVRPGIYREYMKDLCDKVLTSQSHNLHKLLDFHHLACSALFLRSAGTLFWINMDDVTHTQVLLRAALALALWLLAVVVKTAFGYCIKLLTHRYVIYHSQAYQANKPLLRAASGRLPAAPKRTEAAPGVRKDIPSNSGHTKEE